MSPLRLLLDTQVIRHTMQGRDAALLERLSAVPVGQAVISSITLAELEDGLRRKGAPTRLRNTLAQVLLHMDVLPWDAKAATCYGELCATLDAQGIHPSAFDTMIAAHALALDATLISGDYTFAQVDARLRVEVWWVGTPLAPPGPEPQP